MDVKKRKIDKQNYSISNEKYGETKSGKREDCKNGEKEKLKTEVDEHHFIDKKLEEVNGNGLFDWLIALPVGFGYCISLSILVPFLTQIPNLICSHDGYTWNSCETSDICNVEYSPMYKFDESSSFTITNWITNKNLLCISSFDLGLFGSIYMSGYAFGALTVLRLGDIIGRRPILLLSSASNTIIYFLLCFAGDTYLIYALLFIDGAMRMTKGSLAYILMLELIPENKRSKFNSTIILFIVLKCYNLLHLDISLKKDYLFKLNFS